MLACFGICGTTRRNDHHRRGNHYPKHDHPIATPVVPKDPDIAVSSNEVSSQPHSQVTVPRDDIQVSPTTVVPKPQPTSVVPKPQPTPSVIPLLIRDIHTTAQLERLRAIAYTLHQSVEQSINWNTSLPSSDLDLMSPIAFELGSLEVQRALENLRCLFERLPCEGPAYFVELNSLKNASAELKSSIARFAGQIQ